MTRADSNLDLKAMATVRRLLTPKQKRESLWPVLGAAALAAVSALSLAVATIVAPPAVLTHLQRGADGSMLHR